VNEQLDFLTGPTLRDEGTARVWENEVDEWKTLAWNALLLLADGGEPFTSEDVRAIAGDPTRPNAFGSLFYKAARRGIIRRTGMSRKASRPSMHATDLPFWIGASL
jgi:hypothetical protein